MSSCSVKMERLITGNIFLSKLSHSIALLGGTTHSSTIFKRYQPTTEGLIDRNEMLAINNSVLFIIEPNHSTTGSCGIAWNCVNNFYVTDFDVITVVGER